MSSRGGGRSGLRGRSRGGHTPHEENEQPETHTQQQQQGENQEEGEEEEDTGRIELDPAGLWFDDSTVTRNISRAIHAYFLSPWQNYSQVDAPTREQWFKLFKPNYKWKPEVEGDVREAFAKKAALRVKDIHYDTTKKRAGLRPKWMPMEVHEQMMAKVKEGPFLERSEKAKKNRRGGDLANIVPPSHCQGSISASQRAKKLAAKSGGVMPNAVDVYLDTHFKHVPGKGLVPVNDKATRIKETYERNVAESVEIGVQKDLNQVFLETVGGRKKGKVPGLGTSANFYYGTSSKGKGSSSTPSTPSIVSQLSQRLEESEQARMAWERECSERMEAQQLELQRLQEERRTERAYVEEMKKTLEMYGQMFSQCSDFSSFPLDDHHDQPPPPGNSGTCAS